MKNTKPAIWFPTVKTNTGTDRFTEQLVLALNQKGFRAEITWLPHYAEYLPWLVPIPQKPSWANVTHINSWLHSRFLQQEGMPLIVNVHLCVQDSSLAPYKSWYQKKYHQLWVTPIERNMIEQADRVIAVSKYTADQVASFFRKSNIEFIYNGIDTSIFTPLPNKKTNYPFRILFAGSQSHRKGFDMLPEVMRQLGPDFELYYTGGLNTKFQHLPKNMQPLQYLSYPIGMADAYRKADALLFPTRLEGFGLVVAEAMACGLPVVTSNNSALPEVIEQDVSGFLCSQNDISAFVDAIRQLANNEALRKRMTEAARQRVEQNFGVDRMVESYIQVYCDVLSNHQRSESTFKDKH